MAQVSLNGFFYLLAMFLSRVLIQVFGFSTF